MASSGLVIPLNFDLQVFWFGLVAEDVGQAFAILQFHAGPEFQGLDGRLVEEVPKAHGRRQGQQGQHGENVPAHLLGRGQRGSG